MTPEILSWAADWNAPASSRSARTKLVPLSLATSTGRPRLATILENARRKLSASSELTISRCTARELRQVKMHP